MKGKLMYLLNLDQLFKKQKKMILLVWITYFQDFKIKIKDLKILSRQDFLQDLKDFPNDYEKFCSIKDDLLYNFNSSYIQKQCDSCFQVGHEIINCSMLHYVPQKDHLIKRHQYHQIQSRHKFSRRYFKLSKIIFSELDNQEFSETKQQYLKKYYIPNLNNSNKVKDQIIQNINEDDLIEQPELKIENLKFSTILNTKQPFKRDSILAISQIPGNNIDQIKRSINNNKKIGINQSNKKQQLDIQLDSFGLQRQNSLTSRRQSQGVNMINIYQLSLNNNAQKQNYLQELISNYYEINFDEEL